MKQVKEVTIEITSDELEAFLIKHYKDKYNVNITNVTFEDKTVYDPNDWRGEYPPDRVFDKVVLKATEELTIREMPL